MFYQTTLKWVGNGGAVDVQGKRLSFIGYLSVQAGDRVWTDGNVIFGNSPPRSTPNIAAMPKGIPVVGECEEKIFKGYVTKIGGLRAKNIIADDWIVNDKKNFEHGGKIDGQKVIEADIFENEQGSDLFVVTDGFFRKNQTVKYHNHLYRSSYTKLSSDEDDNLVDSHPYRVESNLDAYQGEEITLGVESADIDTTAKIYKNNSLVEEIYLKPYSDFVIEKCWSAEQEIMAQSDASSVNYLKQPAPPESFIASSYARIVSFRIADTGDWDAIVFAAAYGYCFPYVSANGSVFQAIFNSQVGSEKTFNKNLIECLRNLEYNIFSRNYFPFLNIEKFPSFTGDVFVDGSNDEYTQEYQAYIESKLEYYIPLVRFKYSFWSPVNFSSSCLLRVHNGEIETIMKLDIGGGNLITIPREWNEEQGTFNVKHTIQSTKVTNQNYWTFPLTDGFYCTGTGSNILTIFNNKNKNILYLKGAGINIGKFLEIDYPVKNYSSRLDSQAESVAQIAPVGLSYVWNRFILTPQLNCYYYDNSGTRYLKNIDVSFLTQNFPNLKNSEDYFLMNGFFDYFSVDGLFRFNPCISKLSDENYLFGVHDAELFFVGKEQRGLLATKLKNFRLRELKNLSIAKEKSQPP